MFFVRDCVTWELEVMNGCCQRLTLELEVINVCFQRLCDVGFGGDEWLLSETDLRVGGDKWLLSETESWR
jgi:hypothetical protein